MTSPRVLRAVAWRRQTRREYVARGCPYDPLWIAQDPSYTLALVDAGHADALPLSAFIPDAPAALPGGPA